LNIVAGGCFPPLISAAGFRLFLICVLGEHRFLVCLNILPELLLFSLLLLSVLLLLEPYDVLE
jgi:hypothetical protein